jgi:hypothetical protein
MIILAFLLPFSSAREKSIVPRESFVKAATGNSQSRIPVVKTNRNPIQFDAHRRDVGGDGSADSWIATARKKRIHRHENESRKYGCR